jgi:hypothetical protein
MSSELYRTGLFKTQENAVEARSLGIFGLPLSYKPRNFDGLKDGSAYAITIRYFSGYAPPNPVGFDNIRVILNGGYPQPIVLVCAVKVLNKLSINQFEVELDSIVQLGYNMGPRLQSDLCILHKDGSVRYRDTTTQQVEEYNQQFRPTWEFTRFPVLPSIVMGVGEGNY